MGKSRQDELLVTTPIPNFFNDIFAEVRKLALDLLATHNLHDWSFAFNGRKQAMGLCVYHRRTIELSVYFVKRNSHEEILDTILHEIAHALVGPGHAHDAVWERKCLEIGAKTNTVRRCRHAQRSLAESLQWLWQTIPSAPQTKAGERLVLSRLRS